MQSTAVYAVRGASGLPGGTSRPPPDDKHSNVYHLGAILVPKMASLRYETQLTRFKFGSDKLKFEQL